MAWLISAAVVMSKAIRAKVIRDKGIELIGVNEDFAYEWNDMID